MFNNLAGLFPLFLCRKNNPERGRKQPEKTTDMKIQSDRHLTATEKKIIRHLLETGNSEAGTKNISIELKPDGENKFIARIYKYCAPALLGIGFDLRPEMQIPKWNYTGKTTILMI